jgi:cytochrome c553
MVNRSWRLRATLGVVAALVLGGGLGLVVMPVVQGRAAGIDAFTAICRAVGILPGSPARPTPPSRSAPQPVTLVSWTPKTFAAVYRADRANGARIAKERCVACHTVEGNTPEPTIPRNSGQSVFALYKQLQDFRSGARASATMSPLVKDLDDHQIADLAAYYGRLLRGSIEPGTSGVYVGIDIQNIVSNGDVARGLPPCSACHRTNAGGPIETPTLSAQYAQYLEAQLTAFASGTRHNDIYHRMRSVAAKLTPNETRLLAIYYAGQ